MPPHSKWDGDSNSSSSRTSSYSTHALLTRSEVAGPLHPPLNPKTLPAFFRDDVERPRPHGGPVGRNLASTDDRYLGWDFQEFDRHVQALARGLVGLGVKKGDRVGVYACLQWACASVGAVLVSTLALAGVSHLFVVPHLRSSAYVRMLCDAFPALAASAPGDIQEEALPALRHLVVVTTSAAVWAGALEGARPAVDFREVLVWREDGAERKEVVERENGLRADDVVNLQFTSGTTGLPKAVSLTHHNLLNNGLAIGRCMRLSEEDILLTQEKCTALHGVPTHFLGVLAEVQRRRKAGELVDTRTHEKLNLTELTVAPVTFQSITSDPVAKRVETVGRILPHVRAKVVDPDGEVVPIGKPGELIVAGYPLQKGYWNDVEQTQKVMERDAEGTLWMHTGDEGTMDEEGYLRSKHGIRFPNLFPVQIENVMTAHPDIREAQPSQCPTPSTARRGRVGRARTWRVAVAEANAPAWVWFTGRDGTAEELPKTASGKVQKHILREWSKELAERGVGRYHERRQECISPREHRPRTAKSEQALRSCS
ncbi:acyl-CoA synthetase [Epithele typhae]|uniref:acyl-CoA synthetase n=1 Tax=Epithele typhae TaxID=378194 RepID=UPI0020079C0A|nr:acyl-CoA synthetase [Epithele typhae]KAH9941177.1 acyl-CoA synthetase [Epithele typhae]